MSTFTDYMDSAIAALPRLAEPVAAKPLGYGTVFALDLSSPYLDYFADYRRVDPMSPEAIGGALLRRLTSPRGCLPGGLQPEYGYDLRGMLHLGLTEQVLRSMRSAIEAQCRLDPRVERVTAEAAFAAGRLTVSLRVTPKDARQSFSLVFAVTSDSTKLIELAGAA